MANKKSTARTTPKKPTRPTGDNSDLFEVFAEAKRKAVERDGMRITIEGDRKRVFELWPSRFTYEERRRLGQHTGLTPSGAAMMLAGGEGGIESIAAVIAMAIFQADGVMSPMDGLLAWLEDALFNHATEDDSIPMEVEQLAFDDPEADASEEGND